MATVILTIGWQAVVILLLSMGIMGDIYSLLGIDWNAQGIINVVGTTIGLVILEIPLLMIIAAVRWWAADPF